MGDKFNGPDGTLWDQSRVWRPPLYQAKPCKCGATSGCMCRRGR